MHMAGANPFEHFASRLPGGWSQAPFGLGTGHDLAIVSIPYHSLGVQGLQYMQQVAPSWSSVAVTRFYI